MLQSMMRASVSAVTPSDMDRDACSVATHRETLERITAATAVDVVFVVGASAHRSGSALQTVLLRQSHVQPDTTAAALHGPDEIYNEMVSKKLLSVSNGATAAWFQNHYRWVVWKLASMERAFPLLLLRKYLTKAQVMFQIHRRYQTDLCAVRRSIVKKILNRDASSVSCMVLCVACVIPFPVNRDEHADLTLPKHWNLGLVLTDGWYSVYGVADLALSEAMWKTHKRHALVGSKLVVWNAQLQNSTDGVDPLECAVAADPWRHPLVEKEELSRWPYLKLQFNSTRRATFGTPLGLERVDGSCRRAGAGPMPKIADERSLLGFALLKSVPLRTVEVGGGMVRAARVLILRISPVLHLQPKDHTLGPRILCDEHLQLYYDVRAEIARLRRDTGYENEQEMEEAIERFGAFEQLDALPPPTPFVKFDVLCTHELSSSFERHGRQQRQCFGVLTMWRPSQDLLAGHLIEGREYFASNLNVNWKVSGGATAASDFLRLSTTKGSRFELAVSDDNADSDSDDAGESRADRLAKLKRALSTRCCVDIQDAIDRLRAAAEDGSVTNERRMVVDVCVYVLQTTDATPVDDTTKRDAKLPSSDESDIKSEQHAFVQHVFVTDASAKILSIRVTSTNVSIASAKPAPPSSTISRAARVGTSFVFRRGNRSVWQEGSIVCVAGLEVSHFDEQLGVLDCTLVESAQVMTRPSQKSHFFDPWQALTARFGAADSTAKRSTVNRSSDTRDAALRTAAELKKYVDRRILQTEFVPTQTDADEIEAERLTQDFTAHELSFYKDAPLEAPVLREPQRAAWRGHIVKLLAMPSTKSGFPHEIVALAIVELEPSSEPAAKATDRAPSRLQTVYLSHAIALALLEQLSGAGSRGSHMHIEHEQLADNEVVARVLEQLTAVHDRNAVCTFSDSLLPLAIEARLETNERLLNSCLDWERLHATYWCVERIAIDSCSNNFKRSM